MKRRLICLFLCLALSVSLLATAFAYTYTDTEGHWAQPFIDRVTESGLFKGVSDTSFSPDTQMTRAMFVTVLGRLSAIDPELWRARAGFFFDDIPTESYYAPYVAWAYCNGITNGTAQGCFSPDALITRQELACFLVRYLYTQGYVLPGQELPADETEPAPVDLPIADAGDVQTTPEPSEPALPEAEQPEAETVSFADESEIAAWALYSTNLLRELKIILGVSDNDGAVRFLPQRKASRAECAAVLCRMQDAVEKSEDWEAATPVSVALNVEEATLDCGATMTLSASVFPFLTTEQSVTWYSEDPEIAIITQQGVLTATQLGQTTIVALTANGLSAVCRLTVVEPTIALGLSDYEKQVLVFGQQVRDPRSVYTSNEEALSHMTTLVVNTWDIDGSGEKITCTRYLSVHANIADRVAAVFNEIYNLPEKPPIHSLGGYRWATASEHTSGLAIDINPTENYYCDPSGKALVGSHFSPETDPYSIPVGGSVDQIFAKYGFTRGIYWRSGYKDYMHYSFFGT